MTYVYILSDYEECGAENVCATLDRSKLLGLVDENWPDRSLVHEDWIAKMKAGLENLLLSHSDGVLVTHGGWNCSDGWGGMQLHVVELK